MRIKFEIKTLTRYQLHRDVRKHDKDADVLEKAYFFNDLFRASFNVSVDDHHIVERALEDAFQMGQNERSEAIKRLINM